MGRETSGNRKYAPEVVAEATAQLLTGATLSQVADRFGVPTTTAQDWRRKGRGEVPRIIDDLVLDYLVGSLETLNIQLQHFRDPVWLGKQDAHSMASLFGVINDKTIRLLSAMQREPEPINVSESGEILPSHSAREAESIS